MTPQSRAIPTLLTRPQAQGDRFAGQLRDRFGDRLAPVAAPLLAPRFLTPALPGRSYAALILSSETAAQSTRAFPGLPKRAYCVGDRTADTARSLGLTAQSAQGDAAALVALILSAGEAGPLLHLRGAESRGDIAATLTAAGIPTDEATSYDQQPQPLTADARALLNGADPVLVPLFSPRTAEILAAQGPFAAPLWVAALSPAVADAARPLAPARLQVADAPNADALLIAISRLLDLPHA